MSFAPATILAVRKLMQTHVPSLSNVELGIVGDDAHAASGTSYHLGEDALKSSSYSIVESNRDRNGLSNAAAALDVGWFVIKTSKGTFDLRDFSAWLVGQCRAGAADTKDIREIIYSLDGQTVKRWDDLGIRSSGGSSHRTHTHFSWYRDSENRTKTGVFIRWFQHIGAIQEEDDVSAADVIAALKSADGQKAIQTAVQGWTEEDPLSTATPKARGRVGGWVRMSDQRERDRVAGLAGQLNEIKSTVVTLSAAVAELSARQGQIITEEQLLSAIRRVLREGISE